MTAVRNVIIIGSGTAGYTAAVYAARAGLEPLVFEGSVSAGGDHRDAVTRIASGPPPIEYRQDTVTGDYYPCGGAPGQPPRPDQAPCLPG